MQQYVNTNKIVSACIKEPYEAEAEPWETGITRGWQLVLFMGSIDPYSGRHEIVIDMESEMHCIQEAKKLGLTKIKQP